MGYVSAIMPFSTLLAEKKCTTNGSNTCKAQQTKFPENGFEDYLRFKSFRM